MTKTPEEILTKIFNKIKFDVQNKTNQEVKNVIVSIPAFFDSNQRKSLKHSIDKSQLNLINFIDEPLAIAFSYVETKEVKKENILIIDIGQAKTEVSIVEIAHGKYFDIKATEGENNLGGGNFNHQIMEHYRKLFKKKTGLDILDDKKAVQKLRIEIEKAKIKLSTDLEAEIKIESFYSNKTLFKSELTRESFERLNADRFITIINMINKVIKDSNNVTLDEIILTGGSSKIPKLQAMIQNLFKTKRLNTQMNAHSVAFGASICSFQFYENRISYSLGFEKKYAKFSKIIHKGSILPFKSSRLVKNSAKKEEINIRVFKGEKTIVLDNKFIFSKTYYLTDSISIRESCYLEIEFDVDSFDFYSI